MLGSATHQIIKVANRQRAAVLVKSVQLLVRKSPMRKMLLILCLAAVTVVAQDNNLDKVQIKVHPVAGSVYMLEGAGGNIGVSVGEDGIVIVDDQFAPLAPKIRAALKGITDKKLRFVLNTHWHGDHTGGNASFGPDGTIIAHENVRKRLAEGAPAMVLAGKPRPET